MSRNISPKHSVTLTESERGLRDTEDGKLVFTQYRGRQCALLLRGGRVLAASFFSHNSESNIGAVHLGKIKNIAKNIDACFVEIEGGEICFLPMKKAAHPFLTNRVYNDRLVEGDEILVQVEREAQKNKQASVTANVSLSNNYFALTLGSERVGFSARLEREKKEALSDILSRHGIVEDGHFNINPEKMLSGNPAIKPFSLGGIVRTRAGELEEQEILTYYYQLVADFLRLLTIASTRKCCSCLMAAPAPWEAVLDGLADPEEYREIVIDDPNLYSDLSDYCQMHLPEKSLRLYQDKSLSLSSLYSLETKLESALRPKVWLKSGGYLIIEPTEALTVIDVNSGKNETGRGIDALKRINYEAAEEIALQLRLRNLSGIILVDFINMADKESGQELLEHLKSLVRSDKVKTSVVDITPLGLVEITRKKQNRPLSEQMNL